MTLNQPLVSIGLPVYNADRSLQRAIDTLLAQDYPNFELIISDNASTDDTWNICQQYEAQDSRIRIYRNANNLGATANFERVFALAQGEYFCWAAHDDWWEPTFVSQCVKRLETVPDSPLCHVIHVEVNEKQEPNEISYGVDLENNSVWQRTHSLMSAWPMPNVYIYGLFRSAMLRQFMPVLKIMAADTILLLKAAQLGPIVRVDEPLHKYNIGRIGRGLRVYAKSIAPDASVWEVLTWDWRLFFILLRLSQVGATTLSEKLKGAKAAGMLVHRYTGWPLSPKLIMNYLYVLMPESIAKGLPQWLDKHSSVKRFVMWLVGKRIVE
jgi:glycosyltransferase involved in cell wall biosynthesis